MARLTEWWEYKLSPLLAVSYATVHFSDVALYSMSGYLLLLLAAIAVGAIYVSLINDITDIEEDRKVGKQTGIMRVSHKWRWLLPIVCLIIGIIFSLYFWPDRLLIFWYAMAWISFSLYSFKPFRLKHRGVWGVMADAAGAHLFPSLFIVTAVGHKTLGAVDALWLAGVAVWSFCYGLRGILWHQFIDKEKDSLAGVNTFARRVNGSKARRLEVLILCIELAAFGVMLKCIALPITYVFLALYGIAVLLRLHMYKMKPIVFLVPESRPHQVIMLDYYQVFLPVSLLISASLSSPSAWVILLVHVVLFPHGPMRLATDIANSLLARKPM